MTREKYDRAENDPKNTGAVKVTRSPFDERLGLGREGYSFELASYFPLCNILSLTRASKSSNVKRTAFLLFPYPGNSIMRKFLFIVTLSQPNNPTLSPTYSNTFYRERIKRQTIRRLRRNRFLVTIIRRHRFLGSVPIKEIPISVDLFDASDSSTQKRPPTTGIVAIQKPSLMIQDYRRSTRETVV